MSSPFSLPTRVSRLYPIFALVLAITSSLFFYAWQSTETELNNVASVQKQEQSLYAQIDSLTEQQKLDSSKIQVQNQKIADAKSQLATIEQQLADKTKALNTKDQQLTQAEQQLKQQQDQLTQNAADLEQLRSRPPLFSFQNDSHQTNLTEQEAEIKDVVNNAYNYIQDLYGPPYLLNSVVITFVDSYSISGAAAEVVITSDSKGVSIQIHLKSFDKNDFQDVNSIIHEMIHTFHGEAVFATSALEEGMTVAATDAVMQRMIANGKLPHFPTLYLNTGDELYNIWNDQLTVYQDNNSFYADPNVSEVYQLVGTAWFRLYQADPNVFKKINAYYYPKVQLGLTPDTPMVLDAIRASISSVQGIPINVYLKNNAAFNPA